MHHGDLNDDVFIISTGILVSYSVEGEILNYMAPGSLLGEISALFETQRLFSAIAATDADIFVFSRVDFLEFLGSYPALRKTLEEACLLHYKETMDSAAQASGLEVMLPAVEGLDLNPSQVRICIVYLSSIPQECFMRSSCMSAHASVCPLSR